MRLILRYVRPYGALVALVIGMKTVASFVELMLPYVLEHLIDNVAPTGKLGSVFLWGAAMLAMAFLIRCLHAPANRLAVKVSARAAYAIRRDLFRRSLELSGAQLDEFTLPSITSRMTADTYNLQDFIRSIQTMGTRAPLMLLGGMAVTLVMDAPLGLILCVIAPVAVAVVVLVSRKGVPLYDRVQHGVDGVTRVMRENIAGVRVVKALGKESHERARFDAVNAEMTRRETKATSIMSLPGPLMTLLLNASLTLVVLIGARRVDAGLTKSGVIMAFLTYFNMILMGVMGLSRVFLTLSKANASAYRVAAVIGAPAELGRVEGLAPDGTGAYLRFEDVSFSYGGEAGEARRMSLSHVSFSVKRGGSLGIIGPTGCGKTTIVNLLMRFYDATEGRVFVDGKDVRSYEPGALRRRFGAVFQNDVVFADALAENIRFGREVDAAGIASAAAEARAAEFIEAYPDGYGHAAAIHGADLSGGQRQRVLIARALAASPEILVLDDATSALDYRTEAAVRAAVREKHRAAATVIVAQRVSSIMGLDQILVMDEGRVIGAGDHETLLKTCPEYREIYETQTGEGA